MKQAQRILSVFLTFLLSLSIVLSPLTVLAEEMEGKSPISATVNVRVESHENTIVRPTEISTTSFDLQKYVHENQPILKDSPRAIHSIIRALETAGIDTLSKNDFDLGWGGNYIAGIAGLKEFSEGPTSGWMYFVDNEFAPVGVLDYEIQDAESIVVYYVQNFMDSTYSWFDSQEYSARVGEPVNLKLNGNNFGEVLVEGAKILVDEVIYQQDGKDVLTDEKGQVELTFSEPGTYHLSADRTNDQGQRNITRPYAVITITEPKLELPVDTTPPLITLEGFTEGETVSTSRLSFTVKAIDDVDGIVVPEVILNNIVLYPQSNSLYVTELNRGENRISVTAVDQASNKTSKNYTINYHPNEEVQVNIEQAIEKTSQYVLKNGVSSEWQAIGLAQTGNTIPNNYIESVFVQNIKDQITKGIENGRAKITDIERLAIAAVAIGKDPLNIGGHNLIEMIYDSSDRVLWDGTLSDTMTAQGNNGPIFALIALDTKGFTVPNDAKWSRQKLIDELLRTQKQDGSWSLNETFPDSSVDITAMAMIGLSPYKDQPRVKIALEKTLDYLSSIQTDEGGFDGGKFVGGVTSEATSQVIIGLTAYGIDPTSERFTKNGNNLIDHLLGFQVDDGGFMHTKDYPNSNGMATEQALQALVAYQLYQKGKGSLYRFDREEKLIELSIDLGKQIEVDKIEKIVIKGSNTAILLPPNLPEGTKLKVTIPEEQENPYNKGMKLTGDLYNFDFQFPEGLQSGKGSYELSMGVNDETEADKAGIYYYNEKTKQWDYVGGHGKAVNGTITIMVDHFSTYGVFTTEKDLITEPEEIDIPGDPTTDPVEIDNSSDKEIDSEDKIDKVTSNENVAENNKKSNQMNESKNTDEKASNKLPSTATNMSNLLLIGFILLTIGSIIWFIRSRKGMNNASDI